MTEEGLSKRFFLFENSDIKMIFAFAKVSKKIKFTLHWSYVNRLCHNAMKHMF